MRKQMRLHGRKKRRQRLSEILESCRPVKRRATEGWLRPSDQNLPDCRVTSGGCRFSLGFYIHLDRLSTAHRVLLASLYQLRKWRSTYSFALCFFPSDSDPHRDGLDLLRICSIDKDEKQ